MGRLRKWFLRHKIFYSLLIVVIIGFSYYKIKNSGTVSQAVTYSTAKAEKATILSTVSGSGQVSAENKVSIKPSVAGTISAVIAKEGQEVKAGDLIAQLETKDLAAEVKQAKVSVEIAAANLNEKLAGLTKEEKVVSENSVKTAKSSYDQAVKTLSDTKKSNESDLEKAKISLDNSKISLDNAQRQFDSTLKTAGIDTQTESNSLANIYINAKPTLSSTLLKLRASLVTADEILGIDRDISSALEGVLGALDRQTKTNAENSYALAKNELSTFENWLNSQLSAATNNQMDSLIAYCLETLETFKAMDRNIYALIEKTPDSRDVTRAALDGYKSSISSDESSLISSISTIQSLAQNIANTKLGRTSSDLTTSNSIASAKNSLETAKNSYETAQKTYDQTVSDLQKGLESAQRDAESKKIAWDNAAAQHQLKIAPPRAVDVASLRAQLTQARNTYQDKLENLKSARIVSPIDGIVASVAANAGDPAMTGTEIATVITKRKIGTITLNEVDAAKIKQGQKATLAFNAIDGLSITGAVAQVDILGTVAQGVVSYSVKIALDADDERIKPEMSLSATVVTDMAQDALAVPNSAIKSQGSSSYVEIIDGAGSAGGSRRSVSGQTPRQQAVETGLSDDKMTEILSGLDEGALVVTQTISPGGFNAASPPTRGNSGFNILGGGRQGVRMR
jgi:multidrug efflux pump subunit AcrA (membrane-fusion protein)